MHPYRNESFGMRGPRGSYYGRGNVKFAILELLKEKPRHGYDIIREMEERSGGIYSPSPGVIYPTLQALEDQDYVRSTEQDGKKIYSITEAGIPYLQGHQEREGSAHGHGRHGEGFRPPFPPPFPFGPGRRGAGPGTGPEGAAADGADSQSAAGQTPGAEGGAAEGAGEGDETHRGHRGRGRGPHGPGGAAWGPWFASSGGPELMREMRWMFSDFASAIQRTLGDPQKLKEIREVLREAKAKIDDIVMGK
jgi:DNA-binding PadR family transcriptional regulator